MVAPPLIAFGVTIALCPAAMLALRRLQVLDIPGERSSHVHPTPRGGGVAPAAGATVALVASASVAGSARAGLLITACAFGAIGLLEDLVGVPAMRRLALQCIAAAIALPWLLQPGLESGGLWAGVFALGVAVWLVAFVNAFNFMDGIDGISVTQAVVAGLAFYALGRYEDLPAVTQGGAIAAATALAFAPFNFPRAHMFLGDIGSYFLGAWLAALAVMTVRGGVALESALAPLSLYLADTGITLVRRILRGETWYAPHRDHVYQQLVRLGWSHVRTTLLIGALVVVVSGLGALALGDSLLARVVGDTLMAGVLLAYALAPSRWARSRQAG